MKLSTSLLALLPAASLACNHENAKRQAGGNETENPFKFTVGTDGPADPATNGYFINHVALLVSNITASRDWYRDVLGMRHIFTFDMNRDYIISYMGHSQGGRNGTGFQTGEELLKHKNNLAGLLELQQYTPDSADKKFTPTRANTLSHMGLIVPNIQAVQDRCDELGVTVVKRIGVTGFEPNAGNADFAAAWGIDDLENASVQARIAAVLAGIDSLGFKDFIVIADPDGNLFEVQSLVPAGEAGI
ncbi:hypothetical protein BU24DRAFT_418881 [Aaosphaeria arxii CBS 175.79]|uniref:VOC domain-containing protein n=1 Tax=Aaosphaeria arxii CBS 175.79 TaxID=1450172 RepID=A0A6A5Y162_9PLEO|nr:uncharacterized protein BU24DRAFT_418881 [Aaosphaeria arxii CBS 175.79]KAF2019295.1 hypothetical protein BU24DRAFT_418881 [Aaosphaeria arxii CBS 175.79]